MINHDKAAVDACTPKLVFHVAVVLLLFESLVVDTLLWILQNSSLLVRPLCNPEVLFQALRRYAAVTPNRPEATWKTEENTQGVQQEKTGQPETARKIIKRWGCNGIY